VSRRILDATVKVLDEVGWSGLTVDAVSERAGVGRPAIYRRFRGKPELCVAAIDSLLPPPVVDVGGAPEARLRGVFDGLARPSLGRYVGLVGELLGLEPVHPELAAAWRASVFLPRREAGLAIIREARKAGALRDDADDDFVIDTITGHLLARVWRGRPFDDDWRERTWRQIWAAVRRR
jgi:AcrR family transcriptional regulator